MKVVEIEKAAFVQIMAAVYEPLKLECSGLLGGEIHGGRINVKLAQPLQIADRRPASVAYQNEWKRARDLISRCYDFVGGFHSHLKTRVQKKLKKRIDLGRIVLGELDVNTMKDEYPHGIEIVMAMNPSKRRMPVQASEHEITGYLVKGGRYSYKLDIGAYCLDESLRKRKAEIHVPRRVLNAFFY